MAYSFSSCCVRFCVAVALVMAAVFTSYCSGDSNYYIKSTNGSGAECPTLDQPCHPLSHYLTQEATGNFPTNSTIHFLPGIHEVNEPNGYFVVSNADNITLLGYTESDREPLLGTYIVCQSQTIFAFFNISNLTIKNLSFFYCGHPIGVYYSELLRIYRAALQTSSDLNAALMFIHVNSLQVSRLEVKHSRGYGFLGVNLLGSSSIAHSVFNSSNAYMYNYHMGICDLLIFVGRSVCQGGNMLLVFVDPPECQSNQSLKVNTLDISYSVFRDGFGITSDVLFGLETAYPIVHGGGVSALFFQVSYGLSVTLYQVTSYRNRANIGANFFFLISNVTTATAIKILSSETLEGYINVETSSIEVLKGSGLAFLHGVTVNSYLHRCPQEEHSILYNLFYVKELMVYKNKGFEGAGTYIVLQLGTHFPHVTIVMDNCTFLSNSGIVGAGLQIEVDLSSIGIYSVREDFSDPLMYYEIVIENSIFVLNPPKFIPTDLSDVILRNIREKSWNILLEDTLFEFLSIYYYDSLRSVVFLNKVENILFDRCVFASNYQTPLLAIHSAFTFNGPTLFLNNTGAFGGALSLLDESIMFLKPETTLNITLNRATRGGGIYSSTSLLVPSVCFFQYDLTYYSSISVVMRNNYAQEAGDDIYGGLIDSCINFSETPPPMNQFNAIFQIDSNSVSSISSPPELLCYCIDGKPACGGEEINYVLHKTAFPGGTFTLPLVPVGQRNGTVPGVAHAGIAYGEADFAPLHDTQELKGTCTELKYSLSSQDNFTLLYILPQELATGHPYKTWSQLPIARGRQTPVPFLVLVQFLPCPPSFALDGESGQCVCAPILAEWGVKCNISADTPLIQRRESLWINLSLTGNDVIVHDHCPFDFCKSTEMWLDLSSSNSQCAFGHSGVLCGSCDESLSFTLGSSHCKKCSNFHLFLFIPFLIAGAALVLLLIYGNVTVSGGTVNGLIFYANILRANQAVSFQMNESAPEPASNLQRFLSVFIAWLNLDLGIETCFYDGMDAYAHTWLQFTFPIFIWVIVGIIIVLCHYSSTAVKLIGTNAVSVLATLFLLSYAKLQRTIITIFSFTYINNYYPDGSSHVIWLYDGNVPFLQSKHIPLFMMALAATMLFIVPFTLFVLFAPCIQAWSNHKPMKWFHRRFKPLLDAYQAPFKDKFRYWAGLMLVVRNILLFIFALNALGDPNINLTVITTATLPILMFSWVVHRSVPVNILETSFIFNLSILSAWTHYNRTKTNSSQTALVCISTGIAFALFVCIVIYHVSQKLKKTRIFEWLKQHVQCPCTRNPELAANGEELQMDDREPAGVAAPRPVPCTFVELREPLLTDS